ncbi:hypothetical protein [Marinilabilia sp.]|uniref:hypothetical protein n=1 Tax=Marinilabilia sp. TaxID=2021252 RepID=UPI0025BA8684|nr:hypothetical protein [Marinilabilia sp.]
MKKVLFTIFAVAGLLTHGALQAQEAQEDYVKFGGAVRYNIHDKSWNDDKTDPQFTWDTWRLNVDARTAGVDLSFEYRFYPDGGYHMMHHGWLGYGLTDDLYMKIGASQVPFGITSFASHSWWFQIPYYVGLEDDYDMGLKFDYTGIENLELNFAYFHQPEPAGTPGYFSRYSYDITGTADGTASMREGRQFNVRAAYNLTEGVEVGVSGQFGKTLYGENFEESESSNAYAAHVVADFGGFNFKGEYISYDFGAKDAAGNDADVIQMAAYNAPYNVASKANIWVAGLAYTIPVDFGPISSIQPYVDYSVIAKDAEGFENSEHLVPGMLITAGSIYTYVDYAMGKNNAWLGSWTNGLAAGSPDAEWESRFNINIGYYF